MRTAELLDSHAILLWIQDEPGAQVVENMLIGARMGHIDLFVCEINLGEVYYSCIRRAGKDRANEIIEQFAILPIETIALDWNLIRKASELKAELSIAYADCFAIASAQLKGAAILTGDPEFRKASHIVKIDWLGR